MASNLLHDRNGSLARECDRYRVGGHAVAGGAGGGVRSTATTSTDWLDGGVVSRWWSDVVATLRKRTRLRKRRGLMARSPSSPNQSTCPNLTASSRLP